MVTQQKTTELFKSTKLYYDIIPSLDSQITSKYCHQGAPLESVQLLIAGFSSNDFHTFVEKQVQEFIYHEMVVTVGYIQNDPSDLYPSILFNILFGKHQDVHFILSNINDQESFEGCSGYCLQCNLLTRK